MLLIQIIFLPLHYHLIQLTHLIQSTMKKKFDSTLSVTTTWTDNSKQTCNNTMKINGQTIVFRTTMKVQTKEMLDELINMKPKSCKFFKEKHMNSLNLAILKIKREQSKSKLIKFNFELIKDTGIENKILILRR